MSQMCDDDIIYKISYKKIKFDILFEVNTLKKYKHYENTLRIEQ